MCDVNPKDLVFSESCESTDSLSDMTDQEKDARIAELKEQIAALERRIVGARLMSGHQEPELRVAPDSSWACEPTRSGVGGPWNGSVGVHSPVCTRQTYLAQ